MGIYIAPEGLYRVTEGVDNIEGMVQMSGINQLGIISLSFKFHKHPSWFDIAIGIYIAPERL